MSVEQINKLISVVISVVEFYSYLLILEINPKTIKISFVNFIWKIMFKKKIIVISTIFVLSSCASPEVVKTVQISDKDLSCSQLIAATEEAKKFEEDGREERTVTGTNVAAAIFWWPGLVATYINTDDAIDAAKDRQEHLAKIYDEKCSENLNIKSVSKSIENELNNLKRMHTKGLITDEEYKAARKKALGL